MSDKTKDGSKPAGNSALQKPDDHLYWLKQRQATVDSLWAWLLGEPKSKQSTVKDDRDR